MAVNDQHVLQLPMNAEEMQLLQQVAQAKQSPDVASWAREVLLEAARACPAPAPPKKQRAPRPKCGCGWSANAKGECDLTCIMRY